MTESPDTRARSPEAPAAGAPALSEEQGSQAVTEGAAEAVTPAPALDESAATPDRPAGEEPRGGESGERPEILVAGAFAAGLAAALILKRVAGD